MNSTDFLLSRRPQLAAIKQFPEVKFADYERRLAELQATLQRVQQAYLGTSHRAIIVLEGWDTAGKGGVVRRLGWALDPRSFKVHAITAPTRREKSRHYLQRFWERLPENGQIVVFDRSWYGRVLVERVEAYATPTEWRRAYNEINEFEQMLLEDNTRLAKIFLHITPEEQMRRFHARLTDPLKRWKLSYEDFRNRARWKDYEVAIEDMFETTSTDRASWYLVLPTTSRSADWPHSALSPIGFRRTSLWSHPPLIPRWQRSPSNYSALGCPRKIDVEVLLVVFVCRRTPADYPLNYSAFIGQLGWPNLQNGIGLFSPRQAGQKISPQPEQRTPVISGSNLCPQSEQHHSPDCIVKRLLPNMCHPADLS